MRDAKTAKEILPYLEGITFRKVNIRKDWPIHLLPYNWMDEDFLAIMFIGVGKIGSLTIENCEDFLVLKMIIQDKGFIWMIGNDVEDKYLTLKEELEQFIYSLLTALIIHLLISALFMLHTW